MATRPVDGEPLVSVVIPTHGRPETLLDALDSVSAQTYGNIEVVVVDDASPEPVAPLLEETDTAADLDLRCRRHNKNRGANAARNTGIREADGEFVAFLDDDDVWKPDVVEREVSTFLEKGPAVGVVYTGSLYKKEGEIVGRYIPDVSGDVLTDLFCGRRIAPFSNVMIRRTVIDEAGFPDEDLPSLQDREWYFRLAQHCEFEPVPDALVVHRSTHVNRISADFTTKRDISYPRIVARHRPLAARHGRYYERRFLSSLNKTVGAAGLRTGHYRDAVAFLLRSLWYYPFAVDAYLYLLAALGGKYTYEPAKFLKRKLG